MFASWGASKCLLFGVSAWWQCANGKLDEDEIAKQKARASSLVGFAFMIWAFVIIMYVQVGQAATTLAILEAAGVDLSALVK